MKNMILIADSGSTKAEWGILSGNDTEIIKTQGISPYFLSTAQIKVLLQQELLPGITEPENISKIYYYGTGCTAPGTIGIVFNALSVLFPAATIHITYDLVASAHALCGQSKGIACILGTGSNSCYYNGDIVEKNKPGLGYILGDEGGGAWLGKLLIAEYLYGNLEKEIEQEFQVRFGTNKDSMLERVYSSSLPNRFLASFSLFFAEHRGHPHLEKLLKAGLDAFFTKHIMSYAESKTVPVHFTGSISWAYRDILMELCESYGFQVGKIAKEPMKDLLDYYRKRYEA
ncbi:MAG: N-acetylglucosamine kinase [Chitinophagaceae bacterium]